MMTQTNRVVIIDGSVLPRTWAAIVSEFPGKGNAGLRAELRASAARGSVLGLRKRIALTAGGVASLEAVQAVLAEEYRERGFDAVYVGVADPSVYGHGKTAAYLDQQP